MLFIYVQANRPLLISMCACVYTLQVQQTIQYAANALPYHSNAIAFVHSLLLTSILSSSLSSWLVRMNGSSYKLHMYCTATTHDPPISFTQSTLIITFSVLSYSHDLHYTAIMVQIRYSWKCCCICCLIILIISQFYVFIFNTVQYNVSLCKIAHNKLNEKVE